MSHQLIDKFKLDQLILGGGWEKIHLFLELDGQKQSYHPQREKWTLPNFKQYTYPRTDEKMICGKKK